MGKMIIFIVEGESDQIALSVPISKLIDQIDSRFRVVFLRNKNRERNHGGDITSDYFLDKNGIKQWIKPDHLARAIYDKILFQTINFRNVFPEDILLISFTRKATEELRKRIGYDGLNCKTFHSLARGIIAEVTGEKPSISADSFAVNVFYQMLKNKEFKEAVTYYLLYFLSLAKIPHQYATSQEFYSDRMIYGRQAYFTDMDGGIIFTKSEQERRICHFLSTHGVKFRYEEPYEYAVATKQKQQYKTFGTQ